MTLLRLKMLVPVVPLMASPAAWMMFPAAALTLLVPAFVRIFAAGLTVFFCEVELVPVALCVFFLKTAKSSTESTISSRVSFPSVETAPSWIVSAAVESCATVYCSLTTLALVSWISEILYSGIMEPSVAAARSWSEMPSSSSDTGPSPMPIRTSSASAVVVVVRLNMRSRASFRASFRVRRFWVYEKPACRRAPVSCVIGCIR